MPNDSRQADALEITPAMIEAGEAILEERAAHFETRALASMVYTAMQTARERAPALQECVRV